MSRRAAVLLFFLASVAPAAGAEADPLVAAATAAKRVVLAEFVSATCPACAEMEPVVRAVLSRFPRVLHQVHDADAEVALSKKYDVRCVPVYVVVDPRGAVRFNDVGSLTEEQLGEILLGAGARPD